MNSKQKGERTEGIILAHMLQLGYAVLLPFGNNQRYDMAIDKGDGKLIKAQCKTARIVNGCIAFNVSSVNGFTGKRTSYTGQIDIFLVYCDHTKEVYEIPVEAVGSSEVRLRVYPPCGGSKSNIRWAKDFVI